MIFSANFIRFFLIRPILVVAQDIITVMVFCLMIHCSYTIYEWHAEIVFFKILRSPINLTFYKLQTTFLEFLDYLFKYQAHLI